MGSGIFFGRRYGGPVPAVLRTAAIFLILFWGLALLSLRLYGLRSIPGILLAWFDLPGAILLSETYEGAIPRTFDRTCFTLLAALTPVLLFTTSYLLGRWLTARGRKEASP